MQKTILITGSTDGIGLETAKVFVAMGHNVIIHGRNPKKLKGVEEILTKLQNGGTIQSYVADLSSMTNVEILAKEIIKNNFKIDILINNAGIYNTSEYMTSEGLEIRFAVNTFAPYLLTKLLLPIMDSSGRVINLSSAAQSSVDPKAFIGQVKLSASEAYAQSKLAITMWSRHMALTLGRDIPSIIAVNPKSLLGSKMVKEAYGVSGGDLSIGSDILRRASLSDEFSGATGKYYDNDYGQFASPHPDALNSKNVELIVNIIDDILKQILSL